MILNSLTSLLPYEIIFVMDNTQQPLPSQQTDQLHSVSSSTSHSPSKTFIILMVIVMVVAVGVGGYILGANQNQVPQSPPQPVPPITQPSPTPVDETVNWKTFISSEGKFSFKYPEEWYFKTAQENFGTNYKGARIEILFSNKLDKNGKIPSGVSIDRSTAYGLIAVNGCRYTSGCDVWTTEIKFYDTKSPQWQGGGGPTPSIKEISLSELGGKKAILIKSQANTNASAYKGDYIPFIN